MTGIFSRSRFFFNSRFLSACLSFMFLAGGVSLGSRLALADSLETTFPQASPQAPLSQTPPPKNIPFSATPSIIHADRFEGQTDEILHAVGKVELQKADTFLFADEAFYRSLEDELEAKGHVRLKKEGAQLDGVFLKLKLSTQLGYLDQASYQISRTVERKTRHDETPTPGLAMTLPEPPSRQSTAYGQASRIHFEGENQYRVSDGTYSTCKPSEWDWYTKSSEIKLDYDKNMGEAYHVAVYFKELPIGYMPYLNFPLNNQRKSGFLAPSFSSSTRTGLDISIPYYWNIAPNYDATITTRAMAKRGLQLGTELRYRGFYSESELQLEHLEHDKILGESRYAYSLEHKYFLGKGLSFYANWNGVSDDEYFTDLSSRIVQTSKRQLPRQFMLESNQEWWNARLQTLRYQTLNPGVEEYIRQPYFLEPKLDINAWSPELNGFEMRVQGQYARFLHPELEEGRRVFIYPQVSWAYTAPGYYIKPQLGLHSTWYQISRRQNGLPESLHRALPVFSLDTGMTFERNIRFANTDWVQTLEPRLYYLGIPYRDQDEYPVFDTSLTDFNFAQIFSENRFSGYDRINNANQVTAALTTRLIDPATGAERVRAMVGQRYYLTRLKVGLPGEELRKSHTSHSLFAFTGQIAPHLYADMALEYDPGIQRTSRFYMGGRYQPAHGKVFSVAYRYNRDVIADNQYYYQDPINQVDIAAQWHLTGRWHLVGRYNYDIDKSSLVEGIAGVEYSAGCWTARFVAQRIKSATDRPNTSLFFQLELNDFGQIGSSPIDLLRRSIPGYRKINDLPSGGFMADH